MTHGWTEADIARVEGRTVAAPKANKYGRVRKEIDGILFDSTKEARAYIDLMAMQRLGHIDKLERQVPFVLQEKMKGFRAIKMVVDFLVTWSPLIVVPHPQTVIEVKIRATRTPAYCIKRKLFAAKYPNIEYKEWM